MCPHRSRKRYDVFIGRQPPPPGLTPLARREPARSSAIPASHPKEFTPCFLFLPSLVAVFAMAVLFGAMSGADLPLGFIASGIAKGRLLSPSGHV